MKKLKKFAIVILVFVLCLSLSSCNISIGSVDALMRPPKLSGDNSLLQVAFERTLGKSDTVVMKTAVSGDNRSSFMFFDLDNDNVDEAFVFYSDPAVDEMAKVGIFKKIENEWELVSSIKGQGEDIYEVNFADINGDDTFELILCWLYTTDAENNAQNVISVASERIMTVYKYSENSTTLLKTETFSKLLVDDFNGDGSDDLLLVNIDLLNTENRTTARFLSFDENYVITLDTIVAISGLLEVFNMTVDTVKVDSQDHTRIYIDGTITESAAITEVIEIDHSTFEFSLPLYENNISGKPVTLRDSRTSSVDIDNDGIVEIPTLENLPYGERISDDTEKPIPLNLTVWSELSDDSDSLIETDFKCILNSTYGYMFVFANEWTDRITAVYNSDTALLKFYLLEDGAVGDALFMLRAFSELKWDDEHGDYEKISASGALIYGYFYIDNELINADDIKNNFVIIN